MKFVFLMFFFLEGSHFAQAAEEQNAMEKPEWLPQDAKVEVVQKKDFIKQGKFFADVNYLQSNSGDFQNTNGLGAKAGYFFKENWGIESFYFFYRNENNDSYKNVQAINGSVPFVRRFNQTYGALLLWSPFFGKLNTFNRITYFDWGLGAGASFIQAESNIDTVTDPALPNIYKKENFAGGVLKTFLRAYPTATTHLGIEFWSTNYLAAGPRNKNNKIWRRNNDFLFNVGLTF